MLWPMYARAMNIKQEEHRTQWKSDSPCVWGVGGDRRKDREKKIKRERKRLPKLLTNCETVLLQPPSEKKTSSEIWRIWSRSSIPSLHPLRDLPSMLTSHLYSELVLILSLAFPFLLLSTAVDLKYYNESLEPFEGSLAPAPHCTTHVNITRQLMSKLFWVFSHNLPVSLWAQKPEKYFYSFYSYHMPLYRIETAYL